MSRDNCLIGTSRCLHCWVRQTLSSFKCFIRQTETSHGFASPKVRNKDNSVQVLLVAVFYFRALKDSQMGVWIETVTSHGKPYSGLYQANSLEIMYT